MGYIRESMSAKKRKKNVGGQLRPPANSSSGKREQGVDSAQGRRSIYISLEGTDEISDPVPKCEMFIPRVNGEARREAFMLMVTRIVAAQTVRSAHSRGKNDG